MEETRNRVEITVRSNIMATENGAPHTNGGDAEPEAIPPFFSILADHSDPAAAYRKRKTVASTRMSMDGEELVITRLTVTQLDGDQQSVTFDNVAPDRITAADVREKVLRDLGIYRPAGEDGARLFGLFALQPAPAAAAGDRSRACGVGTAGVVMRRIPDTMSVAAFTSRWNERHKDGWRHVVFKRALHVPGSVVDLLEQKSAQKSLAEEAAREEVAEPVLRVAAVDAWWHLSQGLYRCEPRQAAMLLAIHLQATHGDFDPDGTEEGMLAYELGRLFPPGARDTYSAAMLGSSEEDGHRTTIVEVAADAYRKLRGFTRVRALRLFVKFCKKLPVEILRNTFSDRTH